jgi:hypothetical protein
MENEKVNNEGRVQGSRIRTTLLAAAIAALAAGFTGASQAQSVVMAGNYQNFDVLNNTGAPACGFEMEVHGVSSADLTRIFPSNFNPAVIRYGVGTATDFPGGVYVRWMSPYDPDTGQFTACTPVPQSMTTVPGESCWTVGMPSTYQTAGCEHFGISTTFNVNPTTIAYRWLVPDPNNAGQLMSAASDVSIPAPIWTAVPPANPALPPVVVAEVQAPPPPVVFLFGDAQWVKVYKTEHADAVDLADLMGDNRNVVPEDPAQVEVSWSLLQQDPPSGGKKKQRGKLVNQGGLGNGNHAVVRRYEYYQYAGAYDPLTHEALCADLTCTAPGPGELGDAIGAQNAAANLDVNALSLGVSGSGKGSVSSLDRVLSCGNKCYAVYAPGTQVTLTASAASGSTFTGWGGVCAGAGNVATCTVSMDAESAVSAGFGTTFNLSVATSNPGTVTATPAGSDRAIDCGKFCSAKFADGTVVTLAAIPPLGKAFAGWSGACAGLVPTCTLNITANTSVKASFAK